MTDSAPQHSRLSPSKAHQWTECTASIAFVEANRHRLPPDKPSAVAIEGTKAHTVGETYLLNEPVPGYATRDMKMHGRQYAEFCREVMGPLPDVIEWGVERRTPLFYLPQEKGTVDFWCFNKRGIHLVDYKYGYDPVDSVKNKQMTIYALSLITQLVAEEWIHGRKISDATPVTMTIYQPRIGEEPETWSTTAGGLWAYARGESNIVAAAELILAKKQGVFKPSDKICKYCPAIAICEARDKWLLSDLEDELNADELPKHTEISDSRLIEIYMRAESIEEWIKGIREYVEGKKKADPRFAPQLKLVLSRGPHRKWKSEEDRKRAAELMMSMGVTYDDIFTTEMCTPAVADELTKKCKSTKVVELHNTWYKPQGSPIVVPVSDPRPEHKETDYTDEEEWT